MIDLSGLEHISPEVFTCYARLVVPMLPAFARLIRRQALIVPEGLVGSVVAGFCELYRGLGPGHRLFRSTTDAFDWLGCDDLTAARVSALVNAHRQTPPPLHGLRALLASEPGVDIEGAARTLMTSARSLQRALREAGTSFRAEQSAARLEAARELLRGEPMKLGCVARALGMASTSHFVAWFRRETGATPARWRIGEDAIGA